MITRLVLSVFYLLQLWNIAGSDIVTLCSDSVDSAVRTNQTTVIGSQWYPGWSRERDCYCSIALKPGLNTSSAQINLVALVQFDVDGATPFGDEVVAKSDCGPVLFLRTGGGGVVQNGDSGGVPACPRVVLSPTSIPVTTEYRLAGSSQVGLYLANPRHERIRVLVRFTGAAVSQLSMSCSGLSYPSSAQSFSVSSTRASQQSPDSDHVESCSCSSTSQARVDAVEARKREALIVGLLVPLLILSGAILLLFLLWSRFGKRNTPRRCCNNLCDRLRRHSDKSCISVVSRPDTISYHIVSDTSNRSSDTDGRLSGDNSDPRRSPMSFSGYGELMGYSRCWTDTGKSRRADSVRHEDGRVRGTGGSDVRTVGHLPPA